MALVAIESGEFIKLHLEQIIEVALRVRLYNSATKGLLGFANDSASTNTGIDFETV